MHQIFNLKTESEPNNFHDDHRFNWIKSVLYAEIAANLQAGASVNTADIFIFMRENDDSNWSVGYGQFAMAIVQQRGQA
jgi:hypothetical protein